jgi:hypothetical protein
MRKYISSPLSLFPLHTLVRLPKIRFKTQLFGIGVCKASKLHSLPLNSRTCRIPNDDPGMELNSFLFNGTPQLYGVEHTDPDKGLCVTPLFGFWLLPLPSDFIVTGIY